MADAPTESDSPRKRTGSWRQRLGRILGREKIASADAVAEALRESESSGELIEGAQKDMILRAAKFDRLKVADVMRPRAEIVAIEASATLGEAARVFSDSQHSRLPVYGDTLDDPQGFVHVRDVLALLSPNAEGEAAAQFSDHLLTRIKRDILFVPASMTLSTLFLRMQSSRIHLALVVDEYGGTDGLVSMEDLVEQIVGAIDDEHDVEAPMILERAGGVFETDARAPLADLEAKTNLNLKLPDHEDEFDTVAGLAAALAGRVPQRGEILHHPAGLDIEIVDADPRRVKRLRIKRTGDVAVRGEKTAQEPAAELPNARRA
jgi:CBS domain containing-hemolysin-like protein